MARVPGTETQQNRAGFVPGQVVRFRRSRANGSRGLADRRGFVTEVRPGAARVLLATDGASTWIESGSLLPEDSLQDAAMEVLQRVFSALGGLRLETDDSEWTVFSEAVPADAVDEVRALLGPRLERLTLTCFGVHELAVRMVLGSAPPA
jgi:hypothetical protein